MLNSLSFFLNECINFIEIIWLPITLISLFVILFYYFYFFIRLTFYKTKRSLSRDPISIIICAKNELDNLKKNLPVILAQNHLNFEVIVVNDQSTDGSKFFLEEMSVKNKQLVVVDIDNFVNHKPGKKFALTLGIKTAKFENLLLIDADCSPNSKDWAKKMSSKFNKFDIILGYGPYIRKKGLLNKIIRFDTFNVAQQYLSFALAGNTYMGVGRNLAYKRSLFFQNKGFATHIHISSGDDDLFIQEVAPKARVGIEISEIAHTTSNVITKWTDWIYQKRRHISAAPLYKRKFKLLLSLYPLAQLLFFTAILYLILKQDLSSILLLLLAKYLPSYLINYSIMKKLDVFDLYWTHPIYEFLHLIVQGNFVLLNIFQKPQKWSR